MTFVLGWEDGDGVFLCTDSAVTHQGSLRGPTSSFGEAQQVDRYCVEERAVKLLELPRQTVVAICGEAVPALDFIVSIRDQLQYTDRTLPDIVGQLATAHVEGDFNLLFGHLVDKRPTLSAFYSEDRTFEDIGRGAFATLGSLPDDKHKLAAKLVRVVRRQELPAEARLGCTLVALQALGITDYLPQHRVGGAFFGAMLTSSGLVWQPDLAYLTYGPGAFKRSVFLEPGTKAPRELPSGSFEKIRVLVRHGAGILLSSLGSPAMRVLLPPTPSRSDDEWARIVLAAVPPPFHVVVKSRHFGLLSTRYTKATYIFNPGLRRGAFAITERDGKTCLEASSQLVATLEAPTPTGSFDLALILEDADGADAKVYRVSMMDS